MKPLALLLLLSLALSAMAADELDKARDLLAKKSYPEAEAILREAAAKPALAADANYLWYQSLRDRGEPKRGAEKLTQAVTLAPDRVAWRLELARQLLALGRTDEAAAAFIQVLAVQPASAAAHSGLAAVFLRKGMAEAAEAQLREALRANPSSEAGAASLSRLLVETGRPILALQAAQEGLDRRPRSALLTRCLAEAFEAAGEITRALETTRNLEKLLPDDPSVQLVLGRLWAAKNDRPRALAAYRKAIRQAPKDPAGYVGMAWVQADEPRGASEALKSADRALRLVPGHPEATAAKGWAFHKLKRDGDATALLTPLATKQPGSPECMYVLGAMAHAEGKADEAQHWLRQAAAEGAGTAFGRKALALMVEMGVQPAPPAKGTAPAVAPTVQ